jgi:hypothetical protein
LKLENILRVRRIGDEQELEGKTEMNLGDRGEKIKGEQNNFEI